MTPEEERYLRAVVQASDVVKVNHEHLQRLVKRGTKSQVIVAGLKAIESIQTLIEVISLEGR